MTNRECATCKASCPGDSRLCPYCGELFDGAHQKQLINCFWKGCSGKNLLGTVFCSRCGRKVGFTPEEEAEWNAERDQYFTPKAEEARKAREAERQRKVEECLAMLRDFGNRLGKARADSVRLQPQMIHGPGGKAGPWDFC